MATVVNSTLVVPLSAVSAPLIFFDPERAYHISVATYVHIASLGVIVWDVLDNLGSDYKLLRHHKIKIPTVLYFTTRITLLGYCIGRAVLLTRPVDNCAALQKSNSVFSIIFIVSTVSLFSIRVCALYGMARNIVIGFGMTWLICCGTALTIWHTFGAAHIGTTRYCVEVVEGHLLGPMLFIIAANEALMYFAIALRMVRMFPEEPGSITQRFRLTRAASSLPKLPKALLHDSQTYFLVVVITRILVAISTFAFDSPINSMLITTDLTVVNILSSRVFRNLKLNPQSGGDIPQMPTAMIFASSPGRSNTSSESEIESTSNVTLDINCGHSPSDYPIVKPLASSSSSTASKGGYLPDKNTI